MIEINHQTRQHKQTYPLNITAINTTSYKANDCEPAHWHQDVEFIVVMRGSLRVQLHRHEIVLRPKELIIVNSGEVHELKMNSNETSQILSFRVSYDYLKSLFPLADSIRFELKNNDSVVKQLLNLSEKDQTLTSKSLSDVNSQLNEILFALNRDGNLHCKTARQEETLNLAKEILTYIHTHYHESLSLKETAERFYMSREHFARQFKKAFGRSFLDYLMGIRIHFAMKDLIDTEHTLELIRKKHGFHSSKAMIHQFKKRYGVPPIAFRNSVHRSQEFSL